MKVSDIIHQVMTAIDEEYNTSAVHVGTHLSETMVEAIKAAAAQTLRWLALYAPVEMLDGTDETDMPGFITSPSLTVTPSPTIGNGVVTLPGEFVRLARVKMTGWHRAVSEPIIDSSEEYLALADETATATADRPVAALVLSNPKKLELWPYTQGEMQLDIVCQPQLSLTRLADSNDETHVPIPPKATMAFIYHTAFLLLLSYRDNAAAAFRDVALNSLGINKSK